MALLPVVNRILVGAPAARIRIAAHRAEGALCLAIQYGDAMLDDCDALRDVEKRLHALYGASGTLDIRPSRTGQQALMRVPYESTDSRYR